ncbi:MAG: ferredoxin--NADP reductase, partial [Xanthomonadales bacterium]|nr:ferredoxin--NADP reductase [Xanthomonadales bacterium]
GALTSRLQHLQPGDQILLSRKPTGTLLIDDLHPGRCLYLLATGTGLAPFLSIVQDPATYERFETVVVAHGVREIADLAYRRLLSEDLQRHEYLGPMIKRQLRYYPAVSREPHPHQGRLTTLFEQGRINADLGLPEIDPSQDRVMLCGSPGMLADFRALLDQRGFAVTQRIGALGDYVYERAFVEK